MKSAVIIWEDFQADSINYQLSIVNYQLFREALNLMNYQLSIVNYPLVRVSEF